MTFYDIPITKGRLIIEESEFKQLPKEIYDKARERGRKYDRQQNRDRLALFEGMKHDRLIHEKQTTR